jgi:uncharacterized protein with von Willebrand factor type A (vWA) domain
LGCVLGEGVIVAEGMGNADLKQKAVDELLARINWCVNAERPSEEIAKTVELLQALLEKYVAEDVSRHLYEELEKNLASLNLGGDA